MIHGKYVTSFGISYEKSDDLGRYCNRFNGMSALPAGAGVCARARCSAQKGGFSKIADVKQSYLLLPNGESRPINNSSIIPVGSVIIIPPKLDRLSILGLTDIVSRVLGNIATSILAINNVN
mgnify:CR=1 FL=1